VIEPHLRIKFIEAAAQGRDERVFVPDRHLTAYYSDARCRHRHDECDSMLTAHDRTDRAYIDILCEGHASVHTNLAAHDNASVRLFDQAHRNPFVGILAQPVPDRRSTPGEGEKAASTRDPVPILCRCRDMVR